MVCIKGERKHVCVCVCVSIQRVFLNLLCLHVRVYGVSVCLCVCACDAGISSHSLSLCHANFAKVLSKIATSYPKLQQALRMNFANRFILNFRKPFAKIANHTLKLLSLSKIAIGVGYEFCKAAFVTSGFDPLVPVKEQVRNKREKDRGDIWRQRQRQTHTERERERERSTLRNSNL